MDRRCAARPARPGRPSRLVMRGHARVAGRLAVVAAALSAGLLVVSPGAGADADTVASFAESPGCGVLNGDRGPLVGPNPYDPTFRYDALPIDTKIKGPWGSFYGRTIGEVRSRLVQVHLPGQAKDLWINERVLPAFNRVLANLEAEAALGNVYAVRSDTWSFNPAVVPPSRYLSFHGVGAAIDVNSATNPYSAENVLDTDMPQWFVDAWRDAGWCWGGDWIDVKDPMHFSYMGPINSPEDMPDPLPRSPLTAASAFTVASPATAALHVTIPERALAAADVDRDGAPEIVRVQESAYTGAFRVEVARSGSWFATCVASQWAADPPVTLSTALIGDFTRDARPELWVLDTSGSSVVAAVYQLVARTGGSTTITGVPTLLGTIATGIATEPGARFAVADHDRDGYGDLYVITPGAATRIQVWQGPALTTPLVDVVSPVGSDASWWFDVGDYDLDRLPDVYGVSPADPAILAVFPGVGGFSGTPVVTATGFTMRSGEALSVEDYDGDGRDDLYLIGGNGDLRVILGGTPTAGTAPTVWFVDANVTWTWAQGCIGPSNLRVVTNPPVPAQILINGVPADTWGLTWLKLPPGSFQVSFADVEGFTTPAPVSVTVLEGQTAVLSGDFIARGFLRVVSDPPLPATIAVDGVARNDWGVWTDFEPGPHEVCFGPAAGFQPPPCQTPVVVAGQMVEITGTYTPDGAAAGAVGLGMLRVTTSPPVPSQILVDGVPRDSWGLNWLQLPPGTYEVSFRDVAGFSTPPSQTVEVAAGSTTEVVGEFAPRGWLRVITEPAVVATVFVDGVPRNDWGLWTDLPPGQYRLCFGEVRGLEAPACQTVTLTAGEQTTVTASYG